MAIACFMRIAFGGACLGLRLCALILTIVWEINLTTNRINHIALLYLSTLATRTDAATSCPIDAAQQNVFPVTARRYPSRVRRAGVVSGGVVSEQDPPFEPTLAPLVIMVRCGYQCHMLRMSRFHALDPRDRLIPPQDALALVWRTIGIYLLVIPRRRPPAPWRILVTKLIALRDNHSLRKHLLTSASFYCFTFHQA